MAAGDAGEEFVTRLGQLTGANIAASAKRTGSVALGGDWELEVTTDEIQVSLAFEAVVQEAYPAVLATFLVNNTGDFDDGDINNGVTTLREAINAANASSTDDIIEFASGLSGQTITLTNGQLEITDDLVVDGLGADQLTISGNNTSRIFNIDDGNALNSLDVKISGLTIADGEANFGGGIFNEEQLLISSSTIRDNTAQFSGGGIFSGGRLNIENSTISGNTAEIVSGGGIDGANFLSIANVTISGNQAGNNGGGISFGQGSGRDTLIVNSSTLTQNTTNGNGGGIFSRLADPSDDLISINNTIIAQNFDNDSSDGNSPDVWGEFSSNNRFNLIGDLGDNTSSTDFLTTEGNQVGTSANPIDPMLGALQNNGGPTFTHALLPGSPAIDAANPSAGVIVDQRGVTRSLPNADIGAFEALLPPNKRGLSWGDPHIQTFDGRNYEFQTVGEFVLVESNSGDWQVQVRQEPFRNSQRVSSNTAVATLVDTQNVGFYLGQAQPLEIDGMETSISNGGFLTLQDNSRITRVGDTFTLVYAGDDGIVTNGDDRLEVTLYGTHITTEVFLSREREGSVRGLLGNGDMDSTNDFALRDPDRTVLPQNLPLDEIYGEYADSWRISQQESLFNYDPGEDTSTFTKDFPSQIFTVDDLGPVERMNAEDEVRNAGITEGPVFDAAVLDFALSNEDRSFIDAAADVIDQTAPLISLTVDTLVDENDGVLIPGDVSLREAILFALPGATIDFDSSLAGGTIDLTLGELVIDKDLTINGLGADQLTISGNNTSRIFNIDDGDAFNSLDVKIRGLTIADGDANFGGGIFNEEQLLISSSTIRDNTAQFSGGGIFSGGRLNIESSTISGNTAEIGPGGGIDGANFLSIANITISGNQAGNNGGGISFGQGSGGDTLIVNSSTITQNTTNGNGGGIFSRLADPSDDLISINNTIIAQNFDNDSSDGNSPDVWGEFSSNNRFNLIGDLGDNTSSTDFLTTEGNQVGTSTNPIDAMLGALQNNGGPTFTHALLTGSPAIDAANPFAGTSIDQRGVIRPFRNADIGAFEGSLNPSSVGTSGGDRIVLDSGNNRIGSGAGNDVVFGGAGNDRITGQNGYDFLFGEDGDDILWGEAKDDFLDGGDGSDRLFGQNDNDTLLGGRDRDLLEGGKGNDKMTGGEGADIFQISRKDLQGGLFTDRILDFNTAEGDRLRLVDLGMDDVASVIGSGISDLVLTFNSGDRVTFEGVTDATFFMTNVDFDATRIGCCSALPA